MLQPHRQSGENKCYLTCRGVWLTCFSWPRTDMGKNSPYSPHVSRLRPSCQVPSGNKDVFERETFVQTLADSDTCALYGLVLTNEHNVRPHSKV